MWEISAKLALWEGGAELSAPDLTVPPSGRYDSGWEVVRPLLEAHVDPLEGTVTKEGAQARGLGALARRFLLVCRLGTAFARIRAYQENVLAALRDVAVGLRRGEAERAQSTRRLVELKRQIALLEERIARLEGRNGR